MDIEAAYDKIYRYLYYKLKNKETAEDITQQTFLKFWEHSEYRSNEAAIKILYTIAGNLLINEYRRKRVTLITLLVIIVLNLFSWLNFLMSTESTRVVVEDDGKTVISKEHTISGYESMVRLRENAKKLDGMFLDEIMIKKSLESNTDMFGYAFSLYLWFRLGGHSRKYAYTRSRNCVSGSCGSFHCFLR